MSKEKQIAEMQVDLMLSIVKSDNGEVKCGDTAQNLIDKGWSKQSEGENLARYPSSAFECSECHWEDWDLYTADSDYSFCPNCGAKMKGGAE